MFVCLNLKLVHSVSFIDIVPMALKTGDDGCAVAEDLNPHSRTSGDLGAISPCSRWAVTEVPKKTGFVNLSVLEQMLFDDSLRFVRKSIVQNDHLSIQPLVFWSIV